MKNILILTLLLVGQAHNFINSQVSTAWLNRFNGNFNGTDLATSLAVDRLGNIYVTGSSQEVDGEKITTIKYSPSGQVCWVAKFHPSTFYNRRADAIAVDDSFNVFITGFSGSFEYGNTITTIKYDSSGQEEWLRYYGPFVGYATAIAVDKQSNVYVTGYCTIDVLGWDYVTIKYNNCGDQLWVARYTNTVYGYDFPNSIAVDEIGNVYVTGISYDSTTYYDILTVKYNSLGQQQWVRRYDDPGLGGSRNDCAYAIAIDELGSIVVTGGVQGVINGNLPPDYYLDCITIKYNSNGDTLWVRKYDRGFGNDWAKDLAIDSFNNIYIAGTTQSPASPDYLIIKYNPQGEQLWVNYYNGPDYHSEDYASAITLDRLGNIYVTGRSKGAISHFDYATVKYNSNGEEQWVIRYDSPANGFDRPVAVCVDQQNNVVVTGISNGFGTYEDFLTIKYIQEGIVTTSLITNAVAGSQIIEVADASGFSVGDTIIINPGGLTEEKNKIISFGSIHLENPLQYNHNIGEQVIKLIATSVNDNETITPGTFELYQNYPNPFNPSTKIRFTIPTSPQSPPSQGGEAKLGWFVTLKVYDILGNEVATLVNEYKPSGRYEVEFNVAQESIPAIASGVYFYQIKAGDFIQTKKMLYLK